VTGELAAQQPPDRYGSAVAFVAAEVQMSFAMFSRLFFVLLAGIALSGCELAEGIFKAGMAVGVFMVIAVIALVIFLMSKIRRRV
jgi:hypothetical protein